MITVVSGLPRSGTSMMMAMVSAGGLEVLTDGMRTPDESNPAGYFEFEGAKALRDGDAAWLPLAEGKVVKIVSPLLRYLPAEHHYKVIFMTRSIEEILASQSRMLQRSGQETNADVDAQLANSYKRHLAQVEKWLAEQPNIETLRLRYRDVIEDPIRAATLVRRFLDLVADDAAMAEAIDRNLYRERLDPQ